MSLKEKLMYDNSGKGDIEEPRRATFSSDGKSFCVSVNQLSFEPPRNYFTEFYDNARRCMKNHKGPLAKRGEPFLPSLSLENVQSTRLHGVTFKANAGSFTAVIGPDKLELRTVVDLIGCRLLNGSADGSILLEGAGDDETFISNVAYVPRKTLNFYGLSYREMLTYAAKLRIKQDPMDKGEKIRQLSKAEQTEKWENMISDRVEEVISLMDLKDVAEKIIPDRVTTPRGSLGGEIRRLSIAVEIISLPRVIVIDDPLVGLEPAICIEILERLQILAKRGHCVIASIPNLLPQVFEIADSLVLLSEGFSIFNSSPANIEEYFTSTEMAYIKNDDTALIDFVIDIASGVERSAKKRIADAPVVLQEQFEFSSLFIRPNNESGLTALPLINSEATYGYALDSPDLLAYRSYIVIHRALYVKLREREVIARVCVSSCLAGLLIGYLQLNQGNYGYYTMTLWKLPFTSTANFTAFLFLSSTFVLVQQALGIHLLCQKLRIFRYEQQAKCCPAIAFGLGLFIAEVPTTVIGAALYSTISYFLADANKGVWNFFFFTNVLCMQALVGLVSAILFAAVLKKEFAVRDIYLLCTFLMVLLSGFTLQLPSIVHWIKDLTVINPLRWTFQALMTWKFKGYYHDGQDYIEQFFPDEFPGGYENVRNILSYFILVSASLIIVALIPSPNLLKRKSSSESSQAESDIRASRESRDSLNDILVPTRTSEIVKPLLFTKSSSVASKSQLSISISQQGSQQFSHGPTIKFSDITYNVRNRSKEHGYETVLNRVSGQFDWGKLSVIMGPQQSGKSSLLHILAGENRFSTEISGQILLDGKTVDSNIPLWQRCALVESHDELHRDLTVIEVITFAMKLRCADVTSNTTVTNATIAENVRKTMELLHLEEIQNKKCKLITTGDLRRVSIAEEIVHGPSLLLIDEPLTNLDTLDESVLLRTFRELVNQDRTVVTTMYQPTGNVFKLFDTLMLLSEGRVIYHGPSEDAIEFFTSSPYKFNFTTYINPASFLTDICSSTLADTNELFVSPASLESYYQCNDISKKYRSCLISNTIDPNTVENPLNSQKISERKEKIKSEHLTPSTSLDFETQSQDGNENKIEPPGSKSVIGVLCLSFSHFILNLRNINLSKIFRQCWILFQRSSYSLWGRKKLILSTTMLHVALAVTFGIICGNSSDQIYNVLSFFALGSMLLMFTNVQLVYYMHKTNEVLLKEHSRELYSVTVNWFVSSIPMYILRTFNALVYSAITYWMMNLRQDTDNDNEIYFFFMGSTVVIVLIGTLLAEWVMSIVPDMRSAYMLIPLLVFVNFAFSGLFLKFSTLPSFTKGWSPSLSAIRWLLQANFINRFEDDTCSGDLIQSCSFPILPSWPTDYSTYDNFEELFGWKGKTKWECLYILLAMFVAYRLATLICTGIKATALKGSRKFKKLTHEIN
jgi:ABC-type multidrug transport system ATPase subunit